MRASSQERTCNSIFGACPNEPTKRIAKSEEDAEPRRSALHSLHAREAQVSERSSRNPWHEGARSDRLSAPSRAGGASSVSVKSS